MNDAPALREKIISDIDKSIRSLHDDYKKSVSWCVYGCDNYYENYYEDNTIFYDIVENLELGTHPGITDKVREIFYTDIPPKNVCCAYGCSPPSLDLHEKKINHILGMIRTLENMSTIETKKSN